MKRLRIEHVTGFRYPAEATASYNEARMLPVTSTTQTVLTAGLDIEPPASVNQYVDYFGTRTASFDVLAPHRELTIVARSLVEVSGQRQIGGHLTWEELAIARESTITTVETRAQTPRTQPHAEVVALAHAAREEATPHLAAHRIAAEIGSAMNYVMGVTGVNSTAADAWAARSGVCQDIAHVTIGALREIGIPARYVSGYLHPDPDAEIGAPVTGESHAWVEWWAGRWFAFDPTNNTDVGDRHVRVGSGRDYGDVPPVRGVFAGPETSELFVSVTITREA